MRFSGKFLSYLRLYFTRKNLSIALMGFSSGLPIMMTLSTLTYWLAKYGVGKETIGMASLLGLPYALKFLWAPILDTLNAPFLHRLGRRKGWIILCQLGLIAVFITLSLIDPRESPWMVGVLIFSLSFFSASQDIVVDAYRIDYLTTDEQSYGSSSSLMAYRFGILYMGAGAISLSDHMDWSNIFLLTAAIFFLIMLLTLLVSEPKISVEGDKNPQIERRYYKLFTNIVNTFKQFLRRDNALLILIFIISFKLPDAIFGVMANPFYVEMGYSGTEIGMVTKIYGLAATLIGALLAGVIIHQIGLYRSLFFSAILIGVTNLFYLLVLSDSTILSLVIAITFENFISGFASALFIMFLSLLCDKKYSATQYALLSSLSALGLRIFGGSSGFLVESLGWNDFLIITAFLFVPSLLLLMMIRRQVEEISLRSQ